MAARSLTGSWSGSYSYPAGAGPTTPFTAVIEEVAGRLSGTTSEPPLFGIGSETLEAILVGRRDGEAVDFVKTYDAIELAADPVDYVGRVSADGNSIRGVWSLLELDGTFEMRRDQEAEEPVEEEASEAVPVPAAAAG